jgi:hypothetical protein
MIGAQTGEVVTATACNQAEMKVFLEITVI